jgi:hypothetical protein
MAWPPPPMQGPLVDAAVEEGTADITSAVFNDLYGVPFDIVMDEILIQGRKRDKENDETMADLLRDPSLQPDLNWMQVGLSL